MKLVPVTCAYCGQESRKAASHVNRSSRVGAKLYCDRTCAGVARRIGQSVAERKATKAAYDREYRERNRAKRKRQSAAWYAANYDRDKEREKRKARMPQHVEYCRQPEYRFKTREGEIAVPVITNELPAEITDQNEIELNAINLKNELWDTLQKVKRGQMLPQSGDVVASQAREILRTVRTQLAIFSQASEQVSAELIDFAKPKR